MVADSVTLLLAILLAITGQSLCYRQATQQQQQQQQQQPQQQPQQQLPSATQQQQQQQSLEPSSIGSQGAYGAAADYSALVSGGENLVNLGQPFYNSKRARKMSAFMPMRGRKDGRDAGSRQQQQDWTGQESGSGEVLIGGGQQPLRENEAEEASIMRLVGAAGPQASFILNNPGASEQAVARNWLAGAGPAPRHFANQLAARHLLLEAANYPAHYLANVNSGSVPFAEMDDSRPLPGDSSVPGSPVVLMQAKPRRAFHPMRGKKSNGNSEAAASEQAAAAAAYLAQVGGVDGSDISMDHYASL